MSHRKHKSSPFVMIQYEILKDPDFRKLSSSAKVTWIYMRAKFNNRTHNIVTLTYSEMADVLSPEGLSKALKDLIAGGWIIKTKAGGIETGPAEYQFNGKFKHFYYDKQRFKL